MWKSCERRDHDDRPQREPEGDPEFAPAFLVRDDD